MTFTWIRRTRRDGDSWDAIEVPLGEDERGLRARHARRRDRDAHAARRRTPSALYAAADEIADFGAPQTSLAVRVAQLSATVGRGVAADATLTP